MYGEPATSWPEPIWRCWEVLEWRFVADSASLQGKYMGWVLAARHWIQSFCELEALLSERNFEGFVLHRRFWLSSYTWSYFEGPGWLEEDLF